MVRSKEARADLDSMSRGLEVLRFFAEEKSALSTTEVASKLGVTKAMALRIVETLTANHFLAKINAKDRYVPDVASLAIGRSYLDSVPLIGFSSRVLRELAHDFPVTAVLAAPERLRMICLALHPSPEVEGFEYRVGDLAPIASTAMGCAWLWSQKTAVQGELIDQLKNTGSNSRKSLIKLYGGFQQLEQVGYCTFEGEWKPNIASVAVPLSWNSSPSYVLSCKTILGPTSKSMLENEIGPRLKKAAAELSLQNDHYGK